MTLPTDYRHWTLEDLRIAARQATDMANRCDAAGLHRPAALWRHILTGLASEYAKRRSDMTKPRIIVASRPD